MLKAGHSAPSAGALGLDCNGNAATEHVRRGKWKVAVFSGAWTLLCSPRCKSEGQHFPTLRIRPFAGPRQK